MNISSSTVLRRRYLRKMPCCRCALRRFSDARYSSAMPLLSIARAAFCLRYTRYFMRDAPRAMLMLVEFSRFY